MKLDRLVATVLLSFRARALRTILSSLGIVFGVIALVAMLSVAEGAKRETIAQIEQLGTNNLIVKAVAQTEEQAQVAVEELSAGLTLADARSIRGVVPGITLIAPVREVEGTIADLGPDFVPEIVATTRDYFEAKGLPLAEGRTLTELDVEQRTPVCVLGGAIARALGPQGTVGSILRIEDAAFEVVGVLAERAWVAARTPALTARNANEALFLPLGSERSFTWRADAEKLDELSIQLEHSERMETAAAVLRRTLEHRHGGVVDYQVLVPRELLESAQRTQRIFNLVLASVALISLLVGGIGIMNIMLATVTERTREIGLRRAVGADRRDIIIQFLCEALLLTTLGGFCGLAFGFLAAETIAALAGWTTVVTLWSAGLSLAMACGVGLGAGLYPAIRAARLDPVVALRHI